MSRAAIRKAMEAGLKQIQPSTVTVWEGVTYKPTPGVPYQAAWFLWAEPDNAEYGDAFTEQGVLQINLAYGLTGGGPDDARDQAELIRDAFRRGSAFVADGLTTTITRTPEIATAAIEGERYVIPVRIRFHAHVAN